jgi:SSS family solute:Na+ symporter
VQTNSEQFALWRPLSDPTFPWLGILIASPIVGIWYWCTDQYIVQRALSARDLPTARRGALFGGLLKVWPVLIFLVPGLIGWALHQKGLIHLQTDTVDGVTSIVGDTVFPTLVYTLLPSGIRGLIVACLLAALMSSLASLFNSSAALFTVDIYEKLRPGKPEKHLLLVGRVATAVVVLAGIAWIPVMKLISGGGLYQYLQSVQGYLAPPITAVFLLGVFWKRLNAKGAVWALGGGFILGMLKLTCQAIFGEGKVEHPAFLAAIGDFNFLYATGILFVLAALLMVVGSLVSAAPPAEKEYGQQSDRRRDPHPRCHAVSLLQLLARLILAGARHTGDRYAADRGGLHRLFRLDAAASLRSASYRSPAMAGSYSLPAGLRFPVMSSSARSTRFSIAWCAAFGSFASTASNTRT